MPTIILPCKCVHPFQDATYGPGERVHNVGKRDATKGTRCRCTVCGTERDVPNGAEKEKGD